MSLIGYARVSTTDQDLGIQEQALRQAGCEIIRAEKRSGTSTAGREELKAILSFIRSGDVLVVTRLDRLARSLGDLQDIVRELQRKGAGLRMIEQPVDTTTPAGRAFLGMLGVFAEFETSIRRERQLEGIAAAKARGVYQGRKATIDVDAIRELTEAGKGAAEVARTLNISRQSVYRILGASQ